MRAGTKLVPVPAADGEASYTVKNKVECRPASNALWQQRSAAAYSAVARVDGPTARWICKESARVPPSFLSLSLAL